MTSRGPKQEPLANPLLVLSIKDKQEVDNFREFCSEPDRSLAIVAAAIVDDSLGWAIRQRMPYHNDEAANKLFGGDRPMAGPPAKARLALLMGLCSELAYRDLLTINAIRNEFAHKAHSLTFKNDTIRKKCMKLRLAKMVLAERKKLDSAHHYYDYGEDIKNPRERFLITVQLLREVFSFDALVDKSEALPLI